MTQPTITYAIEVFDTGTWCSVQVDRIIAWEERVTSHTCVDLGCSSREAAVALAIRAVRMLRKGGRLRHG